MENIKDRFSKMDKSQLVKVIKMLTVEIDGGRGLPAPHRWSEKIMRQFIRYLYRNLKEPFIAKVEIVESLDQEKNKVR